MALSVASTVVLLRGLEEHDLVSTPAGHAAIGWLIVEDILTVVVLVVIPALGGGAAAGGLLGSLAISLAKLVALVALVFLAGSRALPRVLTLVARLRSRELFTLTVLALQSNGIHRLQYPATVEVESPNGGEVWLADSVREIRWTASGIYLVRIDFSTDDGATWSAIADSVPAGAGSYPWTVPAVLSAACRVRVSDALFTPAGDESDAAFTLAESPLTVLSPNGRSNA